MFIAIMPSGIENGTTIIIVSLYYLSELVYGVFIARVKCSVFTAHLHICNNIKVYVSWWAVLCGKASFLSVASISACCLPQLPAYMGRVIITILPSSASFLGCRVQLASIIKQPLSSSGSFLCGWGAV